MFVTGKVSFEIDKNNFEFENQKISISGVTELPCPPLDPLRHFGRNIPIRIEIQQPIAFEMATYAYISREYTLSSASLGLKFQLKDGDEKRLRELLSKFGSPPPVYNRKTPRIPGQLFLNEFPMRVLVSPSLIPAWQIHTMSELIECKIENISPDGILLSTEDTNGLKLQIECPITFVLAPYNWFPSKVRITGKTKRIQDDFTHTYGNIVRYLGIEFTEIDPSDKKVFAYLLKTILMKIKQTP